MAIYICHTSVAIVLMMIIKYGSTEYRLHSNARYRTGIALCLSTPRGIHMQYPGTVVSTAGYRAFVPFVLITPNHELWF